MTKTKLFMGVLIGCLILESLLTGLIPHSRGYLFAALESKTGPIYTILAAYFLNYLFLDFFQSIKPYVINKISTLFRYTRTIKLSKTKLKREVPNKRQRIQEDIKLSYQNRFTVWAEYFISLTIVIQLTLMNLQYPILLAAALLYALISIFIAYRFNPKLTNAEKSVQSEEANFRSKLTKSSALDLVIVANDATMKAEKVKMNYLLFTKLQLGIMTILPYLVLIPGLLSGIITLGELVKHQATFALIVVNAAILIQLYTTLIKGRASEERVKELEGE